MHSEKYKQNGPLAEHHAKYSFCPYLLNHLSDFHELLLLERKNNPSSSWIFLKKLAGIGCLDFLGFCSIELTLSLDFQGVG